MDGDATLESERAEIARLRAEVERQARLISEIIQLFRAHVANVSFFNQQRVADQILQQLDDLASNGRRDAG